MGFTLVELLVVIAVIGILAALLLPVISRVKDKAIRTKCLSNIKQFDLGLISYAHDNNDRLPPAYNENSLTRTSALQLVPRYTTPDVLWDPGVRLTYSTFREQWDMAVNSGGPQIPTLYWHTLPPSSPDWAAYNSANGWHYDTNLNPTIVPQPAVQGAVVLPAPQASKRVLLAGWVMSGNWLGVVGNNPNLRYTYDYTAGRHMPPFFTDPERASFEWIQTAHLDGRGRFPTGDNLGMLDGSGRWRKFPDMLPRIWTSNFTSWW